MRTFSFSSLVFLCAIISSCSSTTAEKKIELTPEQRIQQKIDTLKVTAQDGDLITRMNDNLISFHVKNLNDTDRTFSHAGVVMTRNGQKMVCNIDANEHGYDTVRYDPIDSFINPKQNYICGLFRYKISDTEKQNFISELNKYHDKNAHFDRVFDLETDSLIYCSEMIAKSMTRATKGRLVFKETTLPKYILPVITKFFEKDAPKNVSKKVVRQVVKQRKYISIDNLYLTPDCTELMSFKLKYFPGDAPE
jgi:hypothetical protein